jgi:hypothetical protein
MSNPDGQEVPVGAAAELELELGLILGTFMALLPLPRAKRAIVIQYMVDI